MHQGNRDFLADLKRRFPTFFWKAAVLELGSLDICGTARDYFEDCRYVGVDIERGPGVDVVAKAKETVFQEGEFDTLVCLSLFEHDADWRQSFSHNLKWLRPGALIILCWGAEGNNIHPPYPWAVVPHTDFLFESLHWPIIVEEAFFEKTKYTGDCEGAYDVVAWKKKT